MFFGELQSRSEGWRDLGVAAGSVVSRINHVEIAPGAPGCPFHCHGAEEEIFFVHGARARCASATSAMRCEPAMSSRAPGTGVAHQFIAGNEGLGLLSWGTRDPNDVVWYPDADKVELRGVGLKAHLEPEWDGSAATRREDSG